MNEKFQIVFPPEALLDAAGNAPDRKEFSDAIDDFLLVYLDQRTVGGVFFTEENLEAAQRQYWPEVTIRFRPARALDYGPRTAANILADQFEAFMCGRMRIIARPELRRIE